MMPITFLKIFLHMTYDEVFPKIEKRTTWKHLWSPWATKWIKKSSKKKTYIKILAEKNVQKSRKLQNHEYLF